MMDDFEKMVVENYQEYEQGASPTNAVGNEIPHNVLDPVVEEISIRIGLSQLVHENGKEMVAQALRMLAKQVGGK